jgi:hypothetical protein
MDNTRTFVDDLILKQIKETEDMIRSNSSSLHNERSKLLQRGDLGLETTPAMPQVSTLSDFPHAPSRRQTQDHSQLLHSQFEDSSSKGSIFRDVEDGRLRIQSLTGDTKILMDLSHR